MSSLYGGHRSQHGINISVCNRQEPLFQPKSLKASKVNYINILQTEGLPSSIYHSNLKSFAIKFDSHKLEVSLIDHFLCPIRLHSALLFETKGTEFYHAM